MDLARVCYSKKVYWDDAKTKSSVITWYRASENALPFPFPHVFSMEVYDTVHWYNPGAGEDQLTGRTYYNGVPPARFTGQAFCGEPEWYLGAPSDAPPLELDEAGWPACCNVEGGAYAYGGGPSRPTPPSSPSAPPSGPTCNGCIEGVGPAVFKVTFTNLFAGCAVLNGTWDLHYIGNCNWVGSGVAAGVALVLQNAPGIISIGLTCFTAPSFPLDCMGVTQWNPLNVALCCTQGTIVLPPSTATVQPG